MNIFYNKAREQLYKEHRQRVLNAKSVLDTFKPREARDEQENFTFEDYLAQIVSSVRPNLFTFTKSPESISMTQLRYADFVRKPHVSRPKKLKSRLIFNGKQQQAKLLKQRDIFMEDGQLHVRSLSVADNTVPRSVMQRYQEAAHIMDYELLRKLLRPKIFLEFYAERNGKPMGHLEIQLYTESCPAVVLEFVRMCTRGERERLKISHVVEPLSLECELALTDNETLADENFEHNTNVVDHGLGPGILTCPLRYVRGTRNHRLRFSITLRPLHMLNGKRLAFGRAFGDLRLLRKVQRYSKTRNGNLQIKVKTCGIEK